MSRELTIEVFKDSATRALTELQDFARKPTARRRAAKACAVTVREHIMALGPNKRGWPSTGFYKAVAGDGVTVAESGGDFTIKIEHPDIPGAMAQRYYGGTIKAKDHLLTIPARQEFYGHRAREFDNLKFGMFGKGGAKFLYVDKGGTRQDANWNTNKPVKWKAKKGLGARAEMMIAYWLKDEVTQDPNPNVIPDDAQMAETVLASLQDTYDQFRQGAPT